MLYYKKKFVYLLPNNKIFTKTNNYMKKKDYLRPTNRVIHLRQRTVLLTGSYSDMSGGAKLGNSWTDSGSDAWDGSSSSGGSDMGGWTDKGGSAWQ